MVKRLLNALDYPDADSVNLHDEAQFRKIVLWLEMNIIKKNSETSRILKNLNSSNWMESYYRYKDELGGPALATNLEELQWILGYAVQIETSKNRDLYLKHAVENIKITNAPSVVTENPLDKLDFRSKEFADGINSLAKLLKISPHPDPLLTLKAVKKLIAKRLSPAAVENPREQIIQGTPFPIQDADLGFDLHDPVLNQAAKVLRMLYIQDLRDLQTRANELIVAVQSVTANPKTDTRLGKVGR